MQKTDKSEKTVKQQKEKILSKAIIYKTTDPKMFNLNPVKTISQQKVNEAKEVQATTENILVAETKDIYINKEFPLYPILKDTVFLNRTFRKQVPQTEKYEFPDSNALPFQDISNSVEDKTPDLQFENLHSNIKTLNIDELAKQESATVTDIMDIDPKIDILNNNISAQNNDSEIIEFVAPPEIANKTFESDIFGNQFLSNSFVGGKAVLNLTSSEKSINTTEEPLERDQTNPENQPRPNRQRQLTRPQRKTFYPYFFSRVLG